MMIGSCVSLGNGRWVLRDSSVVPKKYVQKNACVVFAVILGVVVPKIESDCATLLVTVPLTWKEYGVYGDLIMIYPKP